MNNDFQFIDFSQSPKGGKKLAENEFSIIYSPTTKQKNVNKSGVRPAYLTFGLANSEKLEKYTYCRLATSTISNQVFLVFNNEKGLRLSKNGSSHNIIINNVGLVEWLINRFNIDTTIKRHVMRISEDKANRLDITTFEVLSVVE